MKKFFKMLTVLLAMVFVFTVASCGKNEPTEFTGTAQDFINLLNIDQHRQTVNSDFTVPAKLTQGATSVDITWTSDNTELLKFEKGAETWTAKITQPKEDTPVTFNASVAYKEETAKKQFKVMVARFVSPEETLQNFYSPDADLSGKTSVKVNGYIAYKEMYDPEKKRLSLYIMDASMKGYYYAYSVSCETEEEYNKYVIGAAVEVSGKLKEYQGLRQIGSGTVTFLEGKDPVQPVKMDLTENFVNAGINGKDKLVPSTGAYSTIKGLKITKIAEAVPTKSETYTVITAERAGLKIEGIVNYHTMDATGEDSKALLAAAKALKVGEYVDLTGYLSWFANEPRMTLVNKTEAIKGVQAPEASETEKVAVEMSVAAEQFKDEYTAAEETALLAQSENDANVKFTYEIAENETFKIVEGKLVVAKSGSNAEAQVKITATKGDIVLTKVVDLKFVADPTPVSLAKAIEIGSALEKGKYTDEKYLVSGKLKEIKNDNYGNLVITDGVNDLYIHGTYGADGSKKFSELTNKPVVGDYVQISTVLGKYDAAQGKNGWILGVYKEKTIAEALELGVAQESYTTDKFVVSGTIKEIKQNYHGNMIITDGTNEILVYGTYGADGKDKYGKLEYKPVAGDKVTVLGVIGQFKGTAQLKDAWIIATATGEGGETPEPTPVEKVEFTGVVTMSSFAKGSVTVQAADGKAITLRPNKDIFTEEKWNATFVVGKEILVKGEAGEHKGLNQLTVVAEADVTVKGDKALPEVLDITEIVKTSTDLKADLLAHQSRLVVVKNVTFKGGMLYVGEKAINYYVDKSICATAHELVVNGVYDITGIVNWFDNPQVTPISKDGVKVISEPEVEEVAKDLIIKSTIAKSGNKPDGELKEFFTTDDRLTSVVSSTAAATNRIYLKNNGEFRLYKNSTGKTDPVTITFTFTANVTEVIVKAYGKVSINGQEVTLDGTDFKVTLTEASKTVVLTNLSGDTLKVTGFAVNFAK